MQQELIDRTESGTNYDDLAEEILRLRELQEQTVMDDAAKAAHRERIQELLHFIEPVIALKPAEIAAIPPTSIMREFIGGQTL